MDGGSGLRGGSHGTTFGADLSGGGTPFDELRRAHPEGAAELADGFRALVDFNARNADKLGDGAASTLGELVDSMFHGVSDERAAEIAARLDQIRDDPDFQRYKDTQIGDLPDDPGNPDPSSFDGTGFKPMTELKRKIGEAAIGLGLFFGTPANEPGTDNTIGTNDTFTDVLQASGAPATYRFHGEEPPTFGADGQAVFPDGSGPGELADAGTFDVAQTPQQPRPAAPPPGPGLPPGRRDERD